MTESMMSTVQTPVFHVDDRSHGTESITQTSSAIARGKALKNAMSYVRSPPSKPGAGSPAMKMETFKVECICNREMKTVLCRSCGMTFKGRVRRTCLLHPNNIHLMDLDCCPNCKASHIKEFAETMASKRNI
ncbi:uncharacterized protein CG13380-like [Mizuhopecten yessoensis]|uniref:Uncharacterized protein n=1 Tax=Mizuhopecten yessoensis TaxID=6573 RepID=A0A210QZZ2_MIZYE|nr:uncharacterized protein CG13380-like [Mizuhopecten yessoensis]OWF54328.1 hypothetical protein KP79_PYT12291 [Mizuhopecten yessoensis]